MHRNGFYVHIVVVPCVFPQMRLLFSLSRLFPCLAIADEIKFSELILKTGKVYADVRVMRQEADALTVMHTSGVARVNYEHLPDKIQADLRFDPEKAAMARKEYLRLKQENSRKMLEKAVARTEAETEARKVEENLARSKRKTFIVAAVTPEGILVNEYTPGFRMTPSGAAEHPHGNPVTGMVQPVRGEKTFLLRNYEAKVVADDDVLCVMCYLADETHQYETLDDRLATVRIYEVTKTLGEPNW